MPRLVVYVPFSRGSAGDLRSNVMELAAADLSGFRIRGIQVSEVVVVFLGEEEKDGKQVVDGDFLCVHAHGGPDKYTAVTDNRGEETKLKDLLESLDTLEAEKAAACYFFLCFSAQKGHVAQVWRADHDTQPVYGSDQATQGGLILTTRSKKIRGSVFSEDSGQLRQLK